MCITPITIPNPKKYIDRKRFYQTMLTVPCGKCCECQMKKSADWRVRSYYETIGTFRSSRYVLFDTLTYSDEHLPKISRELGIDLPEHLDFPCFSHSDLIKFFKLLRIRLSRRYKFDPMKIPYKSKKTGKIGYRTKYKHDLIRYFLAGEYGTSESGTHRPHYHVLFYVNNRVDAVVLSSLISDCWKYGRTDGVKYKGVNYVLNKRVFSSNNQDINGVVCYVSKYVEKDSYFTKELEKRISKIVEFTSIGRKGFDPNYCHSDYFKLSCEEIRRKVGQFHLQSQNFGAWLLDNFGTEYSFNGSLQRVASLDYVKKEFKINIPDKDKIQLYLQLPSYYIRKMWYRQEPDYYDPKKRMFVLNEQGREIFRLRTLKRIENYEKSLVRWYNNTSDSELKERVVDLLDGRSVADLATYALYYRNSYIPHKDICFLNIFKDLYQSIDYNKAVKNYCSRWDRIKYGQRYTTFPYSVPLEMMARNKYMSFIQFVKSYTYNQSKLYCFRDFDTILELIYRDNVKRNKYLQHDYEERKRLKDLYKTARR